MEYINIYSYVFSPRPGTTASNLKEIERNISLKRLEEIQKILFDNQIQMNRSLENQEIDVLVENKTEESSKFFARSEYP